MATLTQYDFTISVDFTSGLATDRLTNEIHTSAIVTALDRIDTAGDICSIWFKDPLSVGDAAILSSLVAAHNGVPLPSNPLLVSVDVQKTDENTLLTAVTPRTGEELIIATHNYADPTTWFSTSARRTDKILSDSGDGLTWTSGDPNWIDMVHGKMFDEDAICLDIAHGYSVIVKVNDVVKTGRLPFEASGGDYTVDYSAGTITFSSDQSGNVVKASFSYAVDSTFKLIPSAGKEIRVEAAEAQFTADIVMNDSIVFEVWAYNPSDLPNKMKVKETRYKTMRNLVDEAIGSYPAIAPIGGPVRGFSSELYGFPFKYGTIRKIQASLGVELRVRLDGDKKFTGEHCTATFYCIVINE